MIVSLNSDPSHVARLRAGAAVDVLLLRRCALACAHRLMHRSRDDVPFFFLFRPRPTHHASAQLRSQRAATRTSSVRSTRRRVAAPSWRHCFCRPPGPNGRFKSAKTAPPLHALPSPVASSSRSHLSTTHAPSRRLQPVSVSCTHALRGQASRRRPRPRARPQRRTPRVLAFGSHAPVTYPLLSF